MILESSRLQTALVCVAVLTAALVTFATPALAQDKNRPHLEPRFANDFTEADWALSVLAGDAGAVVLGGIPLAAGLGFCTAVRCDDDQAATLGTVAGIFTIAGLVFGPSLGVYLYGDHVGHDGSYWWSMLGSFGGVAVFTALADRIGTDSPGKVVGVVAAALVLPSLGATVGYWYSLPEGPSPHSQLMEGMSPPYLHPDAATTPLRLELPVISTVF